MCVCGRKTVKSFNRHLPHVSLDIIPTLTFLCFHVSCELRVAYTITCSLTLHRRWLLVSIYILINTTAAVVQSNNLTCIPVGICEKCPDEAVRLFCRQRLSLSRPDTAHLDFVLYHIATPTVLSTVR